AKEIATARELAKHNHADDGRGSREERQQEGEARARQARHGELVGDVRDHRGGDADADSGEEQERIGECPQRLHEPDRQNEDKGDRHGGAEPLDTAAGAAFGYRMAEDYVDDEERAIEERPEE